MTMVAISEIATISVLTRFLTSLADYHQPITSPNLLTSLGLSGFNGIAIYGSFLAVIVLVSSAIKLASTWVNGRVSASIGSTISSICFRSAIYESYQEHTNRHSSDLINRVNYIDGLVGGILQPTAQAVSSVLLIFATSMALLFIEPFITLSTVAIVASLFFILQRLIKRRLAYIGLTLGNYKREQTKLLQYSSTSFRDIKLYGQEALFLDRFSVEDTFSRWLGQQAYVLGSFPKILIEGCGLSILIGLSVIIQANNPNSSSLILTTIGTFAYAFQKVLPAAQQIASLSSSIYTNSYVIDSIEPSLHAFIVRQETSDTNCSVHNFHKSPLVDFKSLQCLEISYVFPASGLQIGPHSLTVESGDFVGFVGVTGAGKSTLIDMIMGLLPPTSGCIYVNREQVPWDNISNSASSIWTSQIAHVSQHLFFTDGTILENICCNRYPSDVDEERLSRALRDSCLLQTISSLPLGLKTLMGESGIRLSGGQRQRIAIARALYRDSPILVLDEATSALDESTEIEVMSRIRQNRNITILSIAHRLRSLAFTDYIYQLKPEIHKITYQQLVSETLR